MAEPVLRHQHLQTQSAAMIERKASFLSLSAKHFFFFLCLIAKATRVLGLLNHINLILNINSFKGQRLGNLCIRNRVLKVISITIYYASVRMKVQTPDALELQLGF